MEVRPSHSLGVVTKSHCGSQLTNLRLGRVARFILRHYGPTREMSIVPTLVKTFFTKRIEDLRNQKSEAIATNKATARLIGNQCSEAVVRGFTLVQDEPESVMGTGKGPTPTD